MLVKVPVTVNQVVVLCRDVTNVRGATVAQSPAIRCRWTAKTMPAINSAIMIEIQSKKDREIVCLLLSNRFILRSVFLEIIKEN